MWHSAKRRAKEKGLEFSISKEDVPDIPELCPLVGIPIKFRDYNGGKGPTDGSPSLDRIDSTKGYIPGNLAVLSHKGNRMKADLTVEDCLRIKTFIEERLMGNQGVVK